LFVDEDAHQLFGIAGKMVSNAVSVGFRQAFDLVIERDEFASLRRIHADGFALTSDFGVEDFFLAFGRQVSS